MEGRRNLCAQIPESLHAKVRAEQETLEQTLSQYVEMILTEHFEKKGGKTMDGSMRTMAIQLSDELFERLKAHLKREGVSQKQFIIDLIQRALDEAETKVE
ncbi:MAG TPA: 4-oxalocrotonate tautomerase [Clostridiales bacterium]|jgi:predicted HicB family RNase H-like nuclease|nr:4-oxalocrotonate tautomerase [Clostridiales bacterium]